MTDRSSARPRIPSHDGHRSKPPTGTNRNAPHPDSTPGTNRNALHPDSTPGSNRVTVRSDSRSGANLVPSPRIRTPRVIIVALAVVIVGLIAGLAYVSAALAGPSSLGDAIDRITSAATRGPEHTLEGTRDGGYSGPYADGTVPDRLSIFDEHVPAVANLDPALRDALQRAATDAARDDVTFIVNSGWRSAAYQERLLDEAVVTYGTRSEAARWVSTPDSSLHVTGDAADIGSYDATAWLSTHGSTYGLCQIYANETWHYELRPDAVTDGCPPLFRDPTEDPRMRPTP